MATRACGGVLTLCPLLFLPTSTSASSVSVSCPRLSAPPFLPLLAVSTRCLLASFCVSLSLLALSPGRLSLHLPRFPRISVFPRVSPLRDAWPVFFRAAARWRCVPLARPPARSPAACKRKEQEQQKERALQPKKQRLVFTDLQRRTLIAIFKENKRPSKEMQVTISQQLGLELNTVSNFFMNARRRCMNRWAEEPGAAPGGPVGAAATFSKA